MPRRTTKTPAPTRVTKTRAPVVDQPASSKGRARDEDEEDMRRGARAVMPMDVHVASRMKIRRLELGLSAERFAELVGVSRQQVEKWEKGFSRLTSARLHEISEVLNIDPGWFFQQFVGGHVSTSGSPGTAGLFSAPIVEMVGLWNRLQADQRAIVRKVAQAFVAQNSGGDTASEDEAA